MTLTTKHSTQDTDPTARKCDGNFA